MLAVDDHHHGDDDVYTYKSMSRAETMTSISTEFIDRRQRSPMEIVVRPPLVSTRPRLVYDDNAVPDTINSRALALIPPRSMQPYVITPGSPAFRKVSNISSKAVVVNDPVPLSDKKSEYTLYVSFVSVSSLRENDWLHCSNLRKSTLVNLVIAALTAILALAITAVIVLSVLLTLKPVDTSFTSGK